MQTCRKYVESGYCNKESRSHGTIAVKLLQGYFPEVIAVE